MRLSKSSDRLVLSTVVAVAVAVRLAYVFAWPQVPACNDCAMYDRIGWNLAQGRGFTGGFSEYDLAHQEGIGNATPEVGLGPAYPAFVAVIYSLAGRDPQAVRVVQAILGGLMLVPLFFAVRHALGPAAARRTIAAAGIWPALIVYSGVTLTEILYACLLALLVWIVIEAMNAGTAFWYLLAGIVAGATGLLREESLLLVPAICLVLLWWRRTGRVELAVFLVATSVVVGAWTVRNYVVFGRVIPITAHGGETLWISVKGWTDWHFDDPELKSLVSGRGYLAQNDALRQAAIEAIIAHPLGYVVTRAARFPDLWFSSHTTYLARFSDSFSAYYARGNFAALIVKGALQLANGIAVVAGVWMLIAVLRRQPDPAAAILAVPIVVTAFIHFWLYASPRYLVPVLPMLLAFAITAIGPAGRDGTPAGTP